MEQVRNKNLRMSVVRWLGRHLALDMEVGALTNTEYDLIMRTLRTLAKEGEDATSEPLRLISAQEAAQMLGISYSQFRTLEAKGAFPFKRKMVGSKTVRYRSTDIHAYMTADDELHKKETVNE